MKHMVFAYLLPFTAILWPFHFLAKNSFANIFDRYHRLWFQILSVLNEHILQYTYLIAFCYIKMFHHVVVVYNYHGILILSELPCNIFHKGSLQISPCFLFCFVFHLSCPPWLFGDWLGNGSLL